MRLDRFIKILQNAQKRTDTNPCVRISGDSLPFVSIEIGYDGPTISISPLDREESDTYSTVSYFNTIKREHISELPEKEKE